ncbi:MAG: type II toxin-antitoxin system VapC family toxin [Ideonella sp.]|nr:type II toxin-antitoxin system VapC family toxin [Ideonella sp.]
MTARSKIAVDTSAIVAIAFGEPEREAFVQALLSAETAWISSVSVVEARMVAHGRRGPRAVVLLDDLLRLPPFAIAAPDRAEIAAAHGAFLAFGKGSGHPASLNFGDIFSYALAKVRDLPLLYKGDDFSETDIRAAVAARG